MTGACVVVVEKNVSARESTIRYVVGLVILLAGLAGAVALQGTSATTVAVVAVIVTLYLIFTARGQFDPVKRLLGMGPDRPRRPRRGERPSR